MSNALYNLQFRGKIKKILAHEQYNSTVKTKGTTLPAVNYTNERSYYSGVNEGYTFFEDQKKY